MDQDAFRRTYREMNERFCAYEKSLLSRHCNCSQAKKICIAEREGVHCISDEANAQCLELLKNLRHQARFALKSNNDNEVLPHGKAMRLQVGGLRGLFSVLYPDQTTPEVIEDVFQLISRAKAEFNSLDNLPFQTLIQHVSAYQGRRRLR
ncbi:MAG: hypothetical protein JAY99_10670 [Candidatus Thiodiazotropha lotti]|uniref:Uncharacterized protein n=1 Tax=Candidatus Thiodiazotropha endoloripes TaxID=1818881 RepID=A0A1E2UQY0_9GAMM|nr:hypothetical protein [Candidatus Thiodiazotropha endoloripes]MCG7900890.1 hypothetical protein [Candidatus Thiodiazotropha weberae]MCG7983486.1 hypothetical protein [Candidatus Thiodiazotropha lotti]MCG7914766.1 hypothetical protein [Candidatus Thiodiazotropha weberae]MCG7992539.1 hypothetical protein [Candidatus Thiodiazotropha lotti]MCG7999980.1 hypothetical protein [Candidatus Thiodiazotropha lotti]